MSASRDGNGTFNRAYNWANDAANSIPITASRFDTEMDGIAAEITNSVAVDGQSTMAGNLKMGGFKVTNLANGSNSGDAVTYSQMNTAIDVAYAKAAKVGEIIDFAGTSLQTDFLACDGSAVSRTTYAALFAAIGTTWGAGDGTTTFNVPNLARYTTVGSGGSSTGTLGNAVGNIGGAETVTLTASQIPSITSNFLWGLGAPANTGTNTYPGASNSGVTATQQSPVTTATGAITSNNTSGNSHNNLQPSAVVYKQIRYQ